MLKVRAKTIAHGTIKKKRTKQKEHNLEHNIATLEKKEKRKSRTYFNTRKENGRHPSEI